MRRISVVGSSGAGKTTLAGQIGRTLGIPHVELDALFWGPNWTQASDDLFREKTVQALSDDAWVMDGNYRAVRSLVWDRADTVIWLDYSLPVILRRLVRRTAGLIVTQEELWNGNRERLSNAFFSRDSLIWYMLKTYRRRRRQFSALLAAPEQAHLTRIHLRSPQAAEEWLAQLLCSPSPAGDARPAASGEGVRG